MDGELVPLVMLPRFTTYAGLADPTQGFTTIGMDVTQYEGAILNVWRGHIVGTVTPGFTIWFEESTDQDRWTPCEGPPGGARGNDPGENAEQQYDMRIKKRWFRIRVQLGGADNVVTCWAVGYLRERGSRPAQAPASRQRSTRLPAPKSLRKKFRSDWKP